MVSSLIGPFLLSVSSGTAENINQDVQLVGARTGLISKKEACVQKSCCLFSYKRGTQAHSIFVNALRLSEMIMSLGSLFVLCY